MLSCYPYNILRILSISYHILICSLHSATAQRICFSWLRHRPDIILISASYQLLMRMMQPSRLCRCLVLTWRHMNIIITSLVIGRDSEGVHMVCTQGLYECCMILYEFCMMLFVGPQNLTAHKMPTKLSQNWHINITSISHQCQLD